jgi:hypothetical protein
VEKAKDLTTHSQPITYYQQTRTHLSQQRTDLATHADKTKQLLQTKKIKIINK